MLLLFQEDVMSLFKEIEKLKFDKRLTAWNVSRGNLSQADLNKHLASLPDSASNVESLKIAEESANANGAHSGADHQAMNGNY